MQRAALSMMRLSFLPNSGNFPRGKRAADVTFLMNRRILKARDLAELTGYHVKHICRLARQEKIDGNRANPGGKQIWWIDDERIRRWIDSLPPRRLLEGDKQDSPVAHPLTFRNYFEKWDRQQRTGQIPPISIELLRHDLDPMFRRLAEILGIERCIEMLQGLLDTGNAA